MGPVHVLYYATVGSDLTCGQICYTFWNCIIIVCHLTTTHRRHNVCSEKTPFHEPILRLNAIINCVHSSKHPLNIDGKYIQLATSLLILFLPGIVDNTSRIRTKYSSRKFNEIMKKIVLTRTRRINVIHRGICVKITK